MLTIICLLSRSLETLIAWKPSANNLAVNKFVVATSGNSIVTELLVESTMVFVTPGECFSIDL